MSQDSTQEVEMRKVEYQWIHLRQLFSSRLDMPF